MLKHIVAEAKRLAAAPGSDKHCADLSGELDEAEQEPASLDCCKNPPVVGPDDPNQVCAHVAAHVPVCGFLGGQGPMLLARRAMHMARLVASRDLVRLVSDTLQPQ